MENNVCRLLETFVRFIYNRAFGSAVYGGLVQEKGNREKGKRCQRRFWALAVRVATLRTVPCRHAAVALVTASGAGGGVWASCHTKLRCRGKPRKLYRSSTNKENMKGCLLSLNPR